MAKGTARNHGSSGELINHYNAVRMRVVGTGSLKLTFYSLQNKKNQQLGDLQLNESTDIQPTRLANFTTQRAALEVKTVNINDYFRINRIIIYSRPVAIEYPQ